MKYFDSHAHYFDEKLAGQNDLLSRLLSGEVAAIVNVGTSPDTSRAAIAQAVQYPRMYTAVGIHPSDCQELTGTLDAHIAEIRTLATDPASKAVAIGEIGLDYYWEPIDYEKQMAYFEAQLALAEELDLPVIIHDREAHGACFETVLRHPKVRGVFHSYSGSREMALELVKRGWYIAFSGTISFKNATRVREVASALPHHAVMIETDAPYLTPHPHRGKVNHSGYLPFTCAALAEAWGMSEDAVAAITKENACRFFGISLDTQSASE